MIMIMYSRLRAVNIGINVHKTESIFDYYFFSKLKRVNATIPNRNMWCDGIYFWMSYIRWWRWARYFLPLKITALKTCCKNCIYNAMQCNALFFEDSKSEWEQEGWPKLKAKSDHHQFWFDFHIWIDEQWSSCLLFSCLSFSEE